MLDELHVDGLFKAANVLDRREKGEQLGRKTLAGPFAVARALQRCSRVLRRRGGGRRWTGQDQAGQEEVSGMVGGGDGGASAEGARHAGEGVCVCVRAYEPRTWKSMSVVASKRVSGSVGSASWRRRRRMR